MHAKIAVALALSLLPVGAAVGAELHTQGQAVEQHTTYVQLIADDDRRAPGFAAVAGLVTCKGTSTFDNAVLWFNDEVLFREGRRGPSTQCIFDEGKDHVYVVEDEAPDPRGNPSLKATGNSFEFTDPNGNPWTVVEYVYHQVHVYQDQATHVGAAGQGVAVQGEGELRMVPYYTWVVEIGAATLDPTIVEYYNFVTIVDFSKLQHGSDDVRVHNGQPGDAKRGNSHNASDPDEAHAFPHTHDQVTVDLYVGEAPEEGPGDAYHEGARAEPRILTSGDFV